jgi:hypothetical protein
MRLPAAIAACILLLEIAGGVAGCRSTSHHGAATAADLVDVRATVRRFPVDGESYLLVADDSTSTAYVPDVLPVPLRHDGLRVVFSGRAGPIPAHCRLPGTPVVLSRIRPWDGTGLY